ncbi:MAG: radical SAM protein [Bacteroides sp.]|nr:radical SAM protein [Bacteroides sp.]
MATPSPTDASIILTYRCPMRCQMCNIWQNPTDKQREITAGDLKSLPRLKFINLTGGEPFLREDLADIVEECYRHTDRIVISTSGWFSDRVIELAKRFPGIGIRISIEGLSRKNDELRGREGGFDRGLATLLTLKEMGVKDIGFGCTVSNHNSTDMLALYQLSRSLGMEFATAAFHNSYYFHKDDNVITNRDNVTADFRKLIEWQLKEKHPKSWFRAFFNMGLINYIEGKRRLLPCEAGSTNFFIDPYGEVFPCNGLEKKYWKESMGNIRQASFSEIWNSEQAAHVRELVKSCPKNCWMVGTASPVMKKYITHPARWAIKNKLRSMRGLKPCYVTGPYNVGQDSRQGNLRVPQREEGACE